MSKVYIVTGAGGIGENIAKVLGQKGDRIVLGDASEKALAAAKNDLEEASVNVTPVSLDVTKKESVKALYETAKSLGEIKGVAHTAGVSMAIGDVTKILEVNMLGTVYMTDFALEYLTEGGSLVNFSSGASLTVKMNLLRKMLFKQIADGKTRAFQYLSRTILSADTAYAVSKRFAIFEAQYLATKFGEKGLRINSIAPGNTKTNMLAAFSEKHPGQAAMSLKSTPLKRFARPEEQAAVVKFLLDDSASYITGINIPCDGGISATTAMMPPIPKPIMDLMMKMMDKLPQSVIEKM